MTEDWNLFESGTPEPSPVVQHQYWTLGLGENPSDLPVDQEYDKLIKLDRDSITHSDLPKKVGRSEEDLLSLVKEAALGSKTVYISMSKWS